MSSTPITTAQVFPPHARATQRTPHRAWHCTARRLPRGAAAREQGQVRRRALGQPSVRIERPPLEEAFFVMTLFRLLSFIFTLRPWSVHCNDVSGAEVATTMNTIVTMTLFRLLCLIFTLSPSLTIVIIIITDTEVTMRMTATAMVGALEREEPRHPPTTRTLFRLLCDRTVLQ